MTNSHRSAKTVLEDHLQQSISGTVEEDAQKNYSKDVVLLTRQGVFRGHAGLKHLNEILQKELPGAKYEYVTQIVEGDVGFLEWSAKSGSAYVKDGADSYVMRDGKIVAQTIHYTVETLNL